MTPDFAAKMGLCFAHYIGRQGKVAVGMDVRLHAHVVQGAVVSGLNAGGVDVVDCGIAPTPAVLHLLKRQKLDGAVLVTGSHTLAPVIGLLFFQSDGGEISVRTEEKLEALYFRGSLSPNPWNRLGRARPADALGAYYEGVAKAVGRTGVEGRRVVIDPGNGAASGILTPLFERLGCHVVAVNDVADGRFPSRSPYPRREVLGKLKREVREASADLGVATDGDGDRAIFVDERGKVAWGDVTGSLFALDCLERVNGGTIVAPVNSSRLVRDICRGRGRLVTTRVGPPAIIDALRSHPGAVFGFEETGKYIWPDALLYGDVALSTFKMLDLMERKGKTLRELASSLPRYHMIKRAFRCTESSKEPISAHILGLPVDPRVQVVTLDGVKLVYPDRSWLLLRPSGTEPFFRCYAEAKSAKKAQELAKEGIKTLREASAAVRLAPR